MIASKAIINASLAIFYAQQTYTRHGGVRGATSKVKNHSNQQIANTAQHRLDIFLLPFDTTHVT